MCIFQAKNLIVPLLSGRQFILRVCCFGTFFFILVSSVSQNYFVLLIDRILTGVFQGPLHMCYTYAIEMVSTKQRSTAALFLFVSQFIGCCFATTMGFLIIPNDNLGWQWYQVIKALPFCLGWILISLLPESPRYLLTSGKAEEALNVIQFLNPSENHNLKLKPLLAENRGSYRSLLNSPTCVKTLLALVIVTSMVRLDKTATGLLLLESLQIPERDGACFFISGYYDVEISCERLKHEDYVFYTIFASSYAVAALISKPMADFFGRRISLQILGIVSTAQLSMFVFCKPDLIQTFLAVSCRAFLSAASMICYLFINESFPTATRTLCFGMSCFSLN